MVSTHDSTELLDATSELLREKYGDSAAAVARRQLEHAEPTHRAAWQRVLDRLT
jgi:hypothetical protein